MKWWFCDWINIFKNIFTEFLFVRYDIKFKCVEVRIKSWSHRACVILGQLSQGNVSEADCAELKQFQLKR